MTITPNTQPPKSNRPNNPTSPRKQKPSIDFRGRRRTLAPTGLAQYLSLDSCDRFLRFYLYKGETDALVRRLRDKGLRRMALQPFGPLLSELGDRIETKVLEGLRTQGHRVRDLTDQSL